uniref:G_PROTEIN_RECEP_F1_2 domain-containing protein n=1 Tax=Panagrellus redivivus TaxID=6233 RepID=A0A7E4VNB0_PANRE
MSIYIATELCWSLTCACYLAYYCVDLIIGSGETFHAYYLYAFGTPTVLFMILIPVALAFLSFDRCLSIIFPRTLCLHRILGYCSIATLLFSIAFIVIEDIFDAAPKSATTACDSFSCITTAGGKFAYTVYKMSYGAIVVILSLVLTIMIQWKLKLSETTIRINKIVLKTLVTLLVFDFVPYLTSLVIRNILEIDWAPTYSPYILLSALDSFCVACLYSQNAKHLKAAKTTPVPQANQNWSSSTKVVAFPTTA